MTTSFYLSQLIDLINPLLKQMHYSFSETLVLELQPSVVGLVV